MTLDWIRSCENLEVDALDIESLGCHSKNLSKNKMRSLFSLVTFAAVSWNVCLALAPSRLLAQENTAGVDRTVNFGDDKITGAVSAGAGLKLIVTVTTNEFADQPISTLLPGYLFEMGCDMETGMWSEMLFNRQFATFVPYTESHTSWYDLKNPSHGSGKKGELVEDWRQMHWFHSGYEENPWYAAPGKVNDFVVNSASTFFQEKSDQSKVTLKRIRNGDADGFAVQINNADPQPGGLAQNGKYLRPGVDYVFHGRLRSVKGATTVRVMLFKEGDWANPVAEQTIEGLTPEFKEFSARLKNATYQGRATFAVWLPPGTTVETTALSLMPADAVGGWRKDVVEMVRDQIKPGVLRWPGGIFASTYDWRDGVGNRDARAVRTNYRWGGFAYNDVGTLEFCRFCEAVKAEPLICVNLFSSTKKTYSYYGPGGKPAQKHGFDLPQFAQLDEGVKLAADWVAYANAPAGSNPMADLRVKDGQITPLKIQYWELENEAFRFFQTAETYGDACAVYARAMKAVDPTIKLGICTYGDLLSEQLPKVLEICGEQIDFLADRGISEENISRKIGIIRAYNEKHGTKIRYSNTEYVVGSAATRASQRKVVQETGSKLMPRVSWGYTLDWANVLMQWQRHGGDVIFTCYNQFANNHQSSVLDTPREGCFAKFPTVIGALFRDTPARWDLQLQNYVPDVNQPFQLQVAWNEDRAKLVIYLLNYSDTAGTAELNLSKLRRTFHRAEFTTIAGPALETIRTVQQPNPLPEAKRMTQENLKIGADWSAAAPPHSFTQIILE